MLKRILISVSFLLPFLANAQTATTTNTLGTTGAAAIQSTTSPTYRLSVSGAIKQFGTGYNLASSPVFILENTTAGTGRAYGLNSYDNGLFSIFDVKAASAARFVIDPNGNIGIGTSAPLARLDVAGTVVFKSSQLFLNSNAYHSQTYISNDYVLPNGGQTNIVGDALLVGPTKITSSSQIPSSRFFRVNFDGNDPVHAVASNTETIAEVGAITNSIFRIRSQASATDIKQNISTFSLLANYPGALMKIGTEGSHYGEIRLQTRAAPISFYMASVEAARIADNGSLLVGTATSNGSKLQVNGGIWSTGFTLPTGAGAGKVLTSDANGVATWQVTTGGTGSSSWTVSGTTISNANTGVVVIGSGSIPTATPADATMKLAVKGSIYAQKLKVTQTGWADYVFDTTYRLRSLPEVKTFIQQNKRLPELPSAAEVEKHGVDVGDNQVMLLKKIEELTLYIITAHEEIEKLKTSNAQLQQENVQIKQLMKRR